jgi:hypothetical protein
VTTDADLVVLSDHFGWPPKLVHTEECDFPLRIIEDLVRRNAVRIAEFDKDDDVGVLAIRPKARYLAAIDLSAAVC